MKTIVLSFLLMLMFAGMAHAQNTPTVDKRQQNQKSRIHEGVASGEVTRGEAVKLHSEQHRINRTERRAKADGKVTKKEKVAINHKQNRASRQIRRDKHDDQKKPGAN
jgi:hypothetical protein